MKKNRKVVAIVGPTGSGKTSWAKELAVKYSGKLISLDSRQVYKGMDIGTAKDKTFPQDLVDIVDPSQNFTLADFQQAANILIKNYTDQNRLPILVGGTGLYLDSVVYGFEIPDLKKESLVLREKLEKFSEKELTKRLIKLDPDSASQIDPQNKRRLVRALEVTMLGSRPFSKMKKRKKPDFDTLIIGIDIPREKLYAKTDARIDQMIKDGLVEEVGSLLGKYPFDLPSLNTIGYKEIIDYLKNRVSLAEAIQRIKYNTHAYIRRQMTWYNKNKDIKWVADMHEADQLVKNFLVN